MAPHGNAEQVSTSEMPDIKKAANVTANSSAHSIAHPKSHHTQHGSTPKNSAAEKSALNLKRVFSTAGLHPFDKISWTKRDALITNERGEVVFCQNDVEVPESWSQMATNVVVSKYFRGAPGTAQREHSVKQLVSRVANTISDWGIKDHYFASQDEAEIFRDELTTLLVEQYGAFNSPVWFNVGVIPNPQCSACFILSVDDNMESLLDLQKSEAMLFKYGSGAGSNLSNIRSSKELLSGGGVPSGPVSFMRAFDAWAGTIKSGGKTRRAAKMQILDVDHPDITEFVNAKRVEEEKAWALIEEGYSGGFNVPGGAYDSVFFQNANLSVRANDDFMNAVVHGEKFATRKRVDDSEAVLLEARDVLSDIARGTWVCGDPGMQFDTIINDWHTCPNSGRINASNPCSEYMHLDDSACNLASINLLKFLSEDGEFDISSYKHAIDLFLTAQEIVVGNASYPTEKIGKNAVKFRQLGLGYANLGALLMSLGMPYDSNEGRSMAACLTAILTGEAYNMSSRIAARMGTFDGYAENRDAMLRVIGKHGDATKKITRFLSTETLAAEAEEVWKEALERGIENGYRNSQATVLAPTGTIAFLMDCDTTGVEPDIALVKYKKLVGGGMLKIVNQSVTRALTTLKYSPEDCESIVKYIDAHDTIEGCPLIKDEHLPVFDCAFKAAQGSRFIHYMGHVRMMAACQPFISGAISKTVNMPESSSAEDIYHTYLSAWQLGLKAIAIYRDNSKRSQPLATSMDKGKSAKLGAGAQVSDVDVSEVVAARKHLPDERNAITHKFDVAGHEGYITVGLFEDNTPGEIFIVMAKEGSTLSGVMDAFATSISIALQYRVPLVALVKKFAHMRFEPSGFTANRDIPHAKSLLDYIFRWMALKFLTPEERSMLGVNSSRVVEASEESEQGAAVASAVVKAPVEAKAVEAVAVKAGSEAVSSHGNGGKLHGGTSHGGNANGGNGGMKVRKATVLKLPYVLDDAPPCTACGSSMMVRQGACYRCLNCGSQGGCG